MTDTDTSYERRIDRAISDCWTCKRMSPDDVDKHRLASLHDVVRVQSRKPLKLPRDVWPNGRAPR